MIYRQTTNISCTVVSNKLVDYAGVVGACRRCSNYIFILDLTSGFSGLDKDMQYETRSISVFGFGATYLRCLTEPNFLSMLYQPCRINRFMAPTWKYSNYLCRFSIYWEMIKNTKNIQHDRHKPSQSQWSISSYHSRSYITTMMI